MRGAPRFHQLSPNFRAHRQMTAEDFAANYEVTARAKTNMFTSGAPAVLFLLCFAPLASTPHSLIPPNAYLPIYRIMTRCIPHTFLRLTKFGAAFSGSKPSPSFG